VYKQDSLHPVGISKKNVDIRSTSALLCKSIASDSRSWSRWPAPGGGSAETGPAARENSTVKIPMSKPLVEIHDLDFNYNGQPALRDINLEIKAGDFMAMSGPNGGGETTLLKILLGLVTPDRGRFHVLGQPPRRVSHRIGYVPQNIHINQRFTNRRLMGGGDGAGGPSAGPDTGTTICPCPTMRNLPR